MEKFDLTDCSILIPIEVDCKEREDHFNFLQTYWHRYFCNYQLIIVEKGNISKLKIAIDQPVDHHLIQFEEQFSSAKVSNSGASLVKTPFFCKFDVDALIHPKAIFDAFERLKKESDLSFLLPFNGYSVNVQDPLRQQMMQTFDWSLLPYIGKEESEKFHFEHMQLKNNDSTGLIHHFRTSVFKKLGGYNEEFIGWGYEDEELVARFEKFNHSKHMLANYTAFHLDHPRKKGDEIQAFKNYYRYLAVKNMSAEEIVEYIRPLG
jgi:predicted glycosyltransferase involved in capsule biosynthesis